MAASICEYCKGEIGYETRFYALPARDGKRGMTNLVHARCHEEALENPTVINAPLDPDASISDADPGL